MCLGKNVCVVIWLFVFFLSLATLLSGRICYITPCVLQLNVILFNIAIRLENNLRFSLKQRHTTHQSRHFFVCANVGVAMHFRSARSRTNTTIYTKSTCENGIPPQPLKQSNAILFNISIRSQNNFKRFTLKTHTLSKLMYKRYWRIWRDCLQSIFQIF